MRTLLLAAAVALLPNLSHAVINHSGDCNPKSSELNLGWRCEGLNAYGPGRYINAWINDTNGPNFCYSTFTLKGEDGLYTVVRENEHKNVRINRYKVDGETAGSLGGRPTIQLKGEKATCFMASKQSENYCGNWLLGYTEVPVTLQLDGDNTFAVAPAAKVKEAGGKEVEPVREGMEMGRERVKIAAAIRAKLAAFADAKKGGTKITRQEADDFRECLMTLRNFQHYHKLEEPQTFHSQISLADERIAAEYPRMNGSDGGVVAPATSPAAAGR